MDDHINMTFRAAGARQARLSARSIADRALTVTTRSWFLVILIGQSIFAFTVASFYGLAALRGRTPQAWSRHFTHGYVPGDTIGNLAVAMHLASAAVIILAGLIQLFPQIRERAPSLHRWNGRLYIVTAFTISIAGLYMTWIRGSVGDLPQHVGSSLMAVLIMLCAAMALRYAMARDFKTHRRWALRLYIVVSASLFIRAALFLSFVLNHGPFGFDPSTFTGPFLTFIAFAQYLVPLAILEIYLRTRESGKASHRMAMAAGLFVLTIAMAAGIAVVTVAVWIPSIRKAYDSRKSIASALSATIASRGVEAAAEQYRAYKIAERTAYNFDEDELNTLGYQLIKVRKFQEAIRIFQLNVEAYPLSGNAYDSLGEACLDAGNKPAAIANYQRSLQLKPNNRDALKMLQKLTAPRSAALRAAQGEN
jgi:tetratricopeptide (TPR) repeat protein